MRAMILAAGRGERMRPLTDSVPKPLLTVGGKPLIVWHIEKLKAAGITEIVINHAWLGNKLEAAFGDGRQFGVQIAWSPEVPGGLETAGGIRQALPLLGDKPFWVVNGDIWLAGDYGPLLCPLAPAALGHLWLVANPPQHPAGDFALSEGLVVGKATGRPSYTFSGLACYRPEAFAREPQGRAPLRPLFERWIAAGQLSGTCLDRAWEDVGTPERLAALDGRLMQEQRT